MMYVDRRSRECDLISIISHGIDVPNLYYYIAPMSTGLNARDQYVALKSSISYPPSPRHSQDSDDSLRALEISEGPATNPQRIGRCILLLFLYERWSQNFFKAADRIQLQDLNFNVIWYVYRDPISGRN